MSRNPMLSAKYAASLAGFHKFASCALLTDIDSKAESDFSESLDMALARLDGLLGMRKPLTPSRTNMVVAPHFVVAMIGSPAAAAS